MSSSSKKNRIRYANMIAHKSNLNHATCKKVARKYVMEMDRNPEYIANTARPYKIWGR